MNTLCDIERFLQRTGMPPTRFGRLVARDPRLVLDLRMGRRMNPPLEARVRAFLERHAHD